MPHLILEIPERLHDTQKTTQFFDECAKTLVNNLSAKLESCKSRVYVYQSGAIVSDKNIQPVILTIKIMSGRTLQARKQTCEEIKQSLDRYFLNDSTDTCVELTELDEVYVK